MYVLRAALTGRMDGPCLVEVCQLLGRQRCATRALAVKGELEKEAACMQTHKRHMHYQELREEKRVIGSDIVESGGKQFRARFCGPGMRWNRSDLERLTPVRAAVMGGTFDSMWHTVYNSPQT